MSSTVRGYGRASTDGQTLSCEQQEAVELKAFDLYRQIKPDWQDAIWGGFFPDDGEHAVTRTSKFRERHSGSLILAASQPGDVILVSNYDRMFANVVDVCETLELVRQRGIKLLILDCDIDTTTDFGESVFKLLAVIKEMEVKDIRRRVREMHAHRTRVGLPCCGKVIGWKTIAFTENGRFGRRWVADHVARRYANDLVVKLDLWNIPCSKAYQQMNGLGFRQVNGRRWTLPTFLKWVRAARAGFPLPNGSHDAAPIPAGAKPVVVNTISADV